jgi:hypothetical protein
MKHARPDYAFIVDTSGKIPDDEPVFLLRAQDINAASTVEYWASLSIRSGSDQDIISMAITQAELMRAWPLHKIADVPAPTASPEIIRDDVITDLDFARAIVMHMTGKPTDPTPMLMSIIRDIRNQAKHTSVLRPWVMALPLRHQGVLLAAIRGCDNAPKMNTAKPIARALRYAACNPADEREVDMPKSFMASAFSHEELKAFTGDWDHLPIHYVQHLMHGCEVIGYHHPSQDVRAMFINAYLRMVDSLHVEPEDKWTMDVRLTTDRIAAYNNATGAKP